MENIVERLLMAGWVPLPWWGHVALCLALTHVTVIAVTLFLHRAQTHRALTLHPAVSHFFRFWLWFTTAMITREWVAVHRRHHATCETPDDPHSPQTFGILRLLPLGVLLYVKAARDPHTLALYGAGTPDDWLERHVYSRWPSMGISLLATIHCILFGIVPGGLIFIVQVLWIPFWAAGVVNGMGHYWGYRNFDLDNASRNIVPWGVIIGGEELHNNHHAAPGSPKMSRRWYEFDIGWLYIQVLRSMGLASVREAALRVPRTLP